MSTSTTALIQGVKTMADFNTGIQSATYDLPSQARGSSDQLDAPRDLVEYLREYARQKPEVAALWCFGIGFILGWKLKPW
jgi:hypothetical protein